jgi:hypothetical protein
MTDEQLSAAVADYRCYLKVSRYDGTQHIILDDRLDFFGVDTDRATGAVMRAELAPSDGSPVIIIPDRVPTKIHVIIISPTTATREMHAALVMELQQDHEYMRRTRDVAEALGEVAEPFLLVHRMPEGVVVQPGESVAQLAQAAADEAYEDAVSCTCNVTHEQPLTSDWTGPMFGVIRDDELKPMSIGAHNPSNETNCTLFVMQVLRRLGAGGVVDLSSQAMVRHLRSPPITLRETEARKVAEKWEPLWASFVISPDSTLPAGGMLTFVRTQLAPLFARDPAPTQAQRKGRKRSHAQMAMSQQQAASSGGGDGGWTDGGDDDGSDE